MGGGGFIDNLSRQAASRRKSAEQSGMVASPRRGERIPPVNPTGPGAPDAQRPAQEVPGEPTPADAPAPSQESPLGPLPQELQASLNRMLEQSRGGMLTQRLRQIGTAGGDDRQHFFNLFGHMPTPRELSGFNLRLQMEEELGRTPTMSEVKVRLQQSDFVDKNPEPFF